MSKIKLVQRNMPPRIFQLFITLAFIVATTWSEEKIIKSTKEVNGKKIEKNEAKLRNTNRQQKLPQKAKPKTKLIKESTEKPLPKCLSFEESDICEDVERFYNSSSTHYQLRDDKITWNNIVIVVLMYKNPQVDKLITAHFDTWLRQVGTGMHIVYITDSDDDRSLKDIVKRPGTTNATIRLFKTSAKKEGYRLRYKVIDSMRIITDLYENEEEKKFFLKIDTDTFLIPHHLLQYINKVHSAVRDNPVQFGKVVCAYEHFCYAGGAMYAFNRPGLELTHEYFTNHTALMNETHQHKNRKDVNLMEHEDFMVTYTFRKATGFPAVMNKNIFQHIIARDGIGTKEHLPVCYHRIKSFKDYYEYYSLFYNEDGHIRTYDEFEEVYVKRKMEQLLDNSKKKEKDLKGVDLKQKR